MRAAAWLITLLLAAFAASVAANGVGTIRLDRADLVVSDDAQPPPQGAPWRTVRLDDRPVAPTTTKSAWYRFVFEHDGAGDERLGLYVAALNRDARFIVNGRVVATTLTEETPRRLLCCAFFAELPAGVVVAGRNTLHVRVATKSDWATGLAPVYVGKVSALWPRYERRLLSDGIGWFIVTLFALAIGGACLLLWWRRRDESTLLFFGLAALALGVDLAIEVSTLRDWSRWVSLAVALFDYGSAALMLIFVLRFAGWRRRTVERGLWAWVGLSVLLQCFSDFYDPQSPIRWWWYTGIAVYVSLLPLMAAIAWQRRDLHSVMLLVGAALSSGLIAWQTIFEDGDPEGLYLWPFHQLGLFIVIGWILLDRFAKALNRSERLNAELEQRVAANRVELQANYERLREFEQQQAVVAERARIMSDMHDGIGGQLISTLSLVEHGEASKDQVAGAIRECIDDLRLAIDSLEPSDDDLLPVLGNLRYRLEGRLKQRGIALDWQVGDVPKLACLTPQNVLHILRILQEAFTNVLKHAQASRIGVATVVEAAAVSIRITDNGIGFVAEQQGSGHGLANMRERARRIGGALEIVPSSAGTTLSLLLPVG